MPLRRNAILVVDDDALVRSSLDLMLRRAGYEVVLAEDGCRALGELSVRGIDLVLLDVAMPETCGFDTLVAMKARRPDLPIVMLSGAPGSGSDGIHQKAAKHGAAAAVLKPVRSADLLELLERLLLAKPPA